jgi:hypothetical protein
MHEISYMAFGIEGPRYFKEMDAPLTVFSLYLTPSVPTIIAASDRETAAFRKLTL